MKIDPKLRVMIAKLLPAQYLGDFLDGNLYMNSAAHFKNLESDVVRADCDEGLESVQQIVSLSIQDKDGTWIPISGIISPLKFRTEDSSDFNMLCMHMCSDQNDDIFDERNLAFGDTFVLITNPPEFLRRVRLASVDLCRPCWHSPVEYVCTETHDGPMGPFRKSSYDYQKEFRIALKGGGGARTTLAIGDIRDICAYGPLAEFSELILRLKPHTPT